MPPQTSLTAYEDGGQPAPAADQAVDVEPPTADADPESVRESLLNVDPSQPVTIAGDTYHVARAKTGAMRVMAGKPTITFEDGGTLAVGPASQGVAWEQDIPEAGEVAAADITEYRQVIVRDRPALPDLGDGVVAMTNERACPDCGERGLFFEEDNVQEARGRAEAVPEDVVELRVCPECDQPVAVHRTPSRASTATVQTRSVSGSVGEVELSGLYLRYDTDIGPVRRETWAYRGLWTAEEVAALVNKRLSGDEVWGFASVEGAGERVVWNDDQPFSVEVSFSRVDGA